MLTDLKRIQYHETILSTIGHTPLVRLNRVNQGYKPLMLAKVEFFNPGGSVKDRIGLDIIEQAEREGRLKPGGTIVESTSGNTGVGLAIAAAVKGYRSVFTLPDKMSQEKIRLLRAYHAEVIVTPTAVPHDSPESYTEVAKRIVRETPNSILADQYYNPKNPEAHYKTTGPEIWEQTGGQVDYFVASPGTGGTITGVGRFLKEKNPKIKIIGVDPHGSVLRDYFYTKTMPQTFKTYKVEGIGQDFIPGTLDFSVIDEMVEVTDKESFLMARRLTREEGIFVGGSSGLIVAGALRVAERLSEKQVMVVLLPDTGERYLSKIYNDEWMRENGFLTPERITLRWLLQSKGGKMPPLVSVEPTTTARMALELVRDHDVSQLPVLENGKCVGSVSESSLMSSVLTKAELLDKPVRDLMEKPFPHLHIDDELGRVTDLLARKNSAVLVQDDKELKGIITRYDVIEYVTR